MTSCEVSPAIIWKTNLTELSEENSTVDLQIIGNSVLVEWGDHQLLLDQESGQEQWLPSGRFSAAASVSRRTLVVSDSNIRVYDPTTKDLEWEFQDTLDSKHVFADIVLLGDDYLALKQDHLYRISGEGALLDSLYLGVGAAMDEYFWGSIITVRPDMALLFRHERLVSVDLNPMKVRWIYSSIHNARTFTSDGEKVYFIPNSLLGIRALDLDSAGKAWDSGEITNISPRLDLVLHEGKLFTGSPRGIYCFDSKDAFLIWGEIKKFYPQEAASVAGQMVMDKVFYVAWNQCDQIRRFSIENGMEFAPIELQGSLMSNFVIVDKVVIYVSRKDVIAQQLPPLTPKEED
jgi:outer membrane protein assembly factor BamB